MAEEPPSDEEGLVLSGREHSVIHFNDVGDDVLKSLISVEGLHRSWRSVGARIGNIDQRVKELEKQMLAIPEVYISRQEWKVVEDQLETRLSNHSEDIGRLDAFSQGLSVVVNEAHQARLEVHSERLDEIAERGEDVRLRSDNFITTVETKMAEMIKSLNDQSVQWDSEMKQAKNMESELRRDVNTAVVEIKEQNAVLTEKVEKAIAAGPELLTTCQSDNIHQAKMLEFLDLHLVADLRKSLDKAKEKMEAWSERSMLQNKETRQAMLSVEEHVTGTCARLQTKFADWGVEVGNCPSRAEFEASQLQLRDDTASLATDLSNLNVTAVSKMNELIGHFAKLHDMFKDHEQALRIQSEELENRGTKYDILLCQTQIDRCAIKDDVDRDITELKSTAEWQTKKIEHFGLGIAMSNKGFGALARQRRSQSRTLRALAASRSSIAKRPTSVGRPSSVSSNLISGFMSATGSHASAGTMAEGSEDTGTGSRGGSELDAKEGGDREVVGSSCTAVSEVDIRTDTPLRPKNESPEEVEGSEIHEDHSNPETDDEEEDDDELMPNGFLLQTQLEALAMGLVGLAHMALRDPVLGTSRSVRLCMEKELLEQLRNMRHWITHKSVPNGWTPDRIATVALRCAHPRPDEVWSPRNQPASAGGVLEADRIADRNLTTSHSTLCGHLLSQSTLAETSVESRPATAPTAELKFATRGLGPMKSGKSVPGAGASGKPADATLGVSGRPAPLSSRFGQGKAAGPGSLPPLSGRLGA